MKSVNVVTFGGPLSWCEIQLEVWRIGSDTGIRTRILALRGLRPNP